MLNGPQCSKKEVIMEKIRNGTFEIHKRMDSVIQEIPAQYRYLPLFGNILKLEYLKEFDYEEWTDIYNIRLLVADEAELYKIQIFMKNVHGSISFNVSEVLSGFSICDMQEDGYEQDTRYRVYDFENGDFSIYCEDIEVALLKNPK